ncbi:MAG: precorrin-2 C(20)-methyltransferase [Candidatus Binataceae bacterium]|nr:precorrin-2 C(20)-methyltransferase [Candidatus Binataceae bacterium]
MSYGKLYGVGVGPGAPDLMTIRAVETLKRVAVLALPRSSDYGASMAWKIIEPVIGKVPGQERLFLTFPMSKEPARLRSAWDAAFAKIGEQLERGRSVAFATEGDPSLYSTFGYLQREASQRWPGIQVEVVPGVSSITAVPAVTGTALADGLERIAIIPANYGVDDLVATLNAFDTTILMKIGSEMSRVVDALERTGLTEKAVYVSKATMREQKIVKDFSAVRGESGDCFAMIIVTRKERSGVLAGEVESTAELARVEA